MLWYVTDAENEVKSMNFSMMKGNKGTVYYLLLLFCYILRHVWLDLDYGKGTKY